MRPMNEGGESQGKPCMHVIRIGALVCMLVAMAAPLPLGLLEHFGPIGIRQALVDGVPLIGEPPPATPPRPMLGNLLSREFQTAVDANLGPILYPRSLIVRLTNEVYYDLFSKSQMFGRQILVGKQGVLFGSDYVAVYCRASQPQPTFPFVAKLADLNARLAKRGRVLLFVMTPSKAATMPEFLPSGACGPPANPLAGPASLVAELRHAGIPVIDGITLARTMGAQDPVAAFPRGGTHWSNLVAARVGGLVMSAVDQLAGEDFGGFKLGPPRWDAAPQGSDLDLAELLNLYRPPVDYVTGKADINCAPTAAGRDTLLVAVGGSFTIGLLAPMQQCKLFKEIDYYNYYQHLTAFPGGAARPVVRKETDWRSILAGPGQSVLVVELNELYMTGGQPYPWLDPFLDDALAALQ